MSLELILAAIQAEAARSGPGRHTITFGARSMPFSVPLSLLRDAVSVEDADRAKGEDEDVTDDPTAGNVVEKDDAMSYTCSGTASSTSVDWYGTEMSRACLDDMAKQFKRGVGVYVGHGGFFGDGIEWTDEIGVTIDAEVSNADVAEPAAKKEQGAVCKVEMRFEYDAQSATKVRDAVRALAQRLAKKRPLGLSIGGWFRDVTYITGEDGELERVIINKVDLDHLATTRRPANPDCLDMAMLSIAVREGLKTFAGAAGKVQTLPEDEHQRVGRVATAAGMETGDAGQPHHRATAPEVEPQTAPAPVVIDPQPELRTTPAAPAAEPAQPSAPSQRDEPAPAASTPSVLDESASIQARTDDTHPVPGDAREEIDMTAEELQRMLNDSLARALAAHGISAPSQAATDLDAGNTRAGKMDPPVPVQTFQVPAGADLIRSRIIVDEAKANAGNLRADMAPAMRQLAFGRSEGFASNELIATYREPSPAQRRAVLLGLAHQLRTIGASTELADVVQDSADVLSLNITGLRGLRAESQADKDRVGAEAPDLLLRALRHASNDGHPTFKAPGQREAIVRALGVSSASDKVTTALVSQILQQLSNVQLGARTQLRRIPGAGTSYVTPKRTVSSTLAEWVADGTAPTEDSGTWDNATWSYKTIATRIKVTRKAIAQGAQWGDIVAAEALNKGEDFNRQEEVTIFQGDSANSLPTANAPNGLLTLIASTGRVSNTTANAGDTLSLQKLDETIIKVKGRENKANLRIFASEKGHVYLNAVLQADQTFMNVTMVQAGFVVQTYQGIPIVESSGIGDAHVWNGTDGQITKFSTGSTTAIVVVNLTHAYLVVLTPMSMEQVSSATAQYQEYEMFADEVIVLDNSFGAAYLGGIKVV